MERKFYKGNTMLFLFLVMVFVSGSQASNFRLPKIEGYFVHWCLTWSKQCGKPAADKFCQIKGFKEATLFKKFEDIGHTKILGNNKTCHNPDCDAFLYIKCVPKAGSKINPGANPYSGPNSNNAQQPLKKQLNRPLKQRILNPRISGVRVDYCLQGSTQCGIPVADRYCRRHGFSHSIGNRMKTGVKQTANILTGKACGGTNCKSFVYIDCHR